jgi:formylglycine-generating enzyme required for sulfatase activity
MTLKHPQFAAPLFALLLLASIPVAQAQSDFDVGDEFSDKLRTGGEGPLMVVLPPGRYVYGGGRASADGMGQVTLERPFAVAATEITAGQYRQFLEASRSGALRKFSITNDALPVYSVSWDEAEAYVTWLSRASGHYYRLPSASEWEYAARAGASTTYHWGDAVGENLANCLNCKTEFNGRIAPVKSFPPNAWKLYDMHGNVWEWTKDCVDSNAAPPPNGLPQLFGNCDSRELRGGSAEADAWSVRANARAFGPRKMKSNDVGFRVVMDIPE